MLGIHTTNIPPASSTNCVCKSSCDDLAIADTVTAKDPTLLSPRIVHLTVAYTNKNTPLTRYGQFMDKTAGAFRQAEARRWRLKRAGPSTAQPKSTKLWGDQK